MKIALFIRNSFCMLLAVVLSIVVCSCEKANVDDEETKVSFTKNINGNIVSLSGVEYEFAATEPSLRYLGELVYEGSIEGEEKSSMHLGYSYKTGMFSIKGDSEKSILIRKLPDNEWRSIYRKTTLPAMDFSVDNCSRLELVLGSQDSEKHAIHVSCGEGLDKKTDIIEFLSDVRSQPSPYEVGLYELITKPDGLLENCYVYGVVYGFFIDEPNLVVYMQVTSYNDLAYSISIDDKEYVLPEKWLQELL